MDENILSVIENYSRAVNFINNDLPELETEAYFCLLERDDIQNNWEQFTQEEKSQLQAADSVLRQKADVFSVILPAKRSTPQARAEGRWWWFLNEPQR